MRNCLIWALKNSINFILTALGPSVCPPTVPSFWRERRLPQIKEEEERKKKKKEKQQRDRDCIFFTFFYIFFLLLVLLVLLVLFF